MPENLVISLKISNFVVENHFFSNLDMYYKDYLQKPLFIATPGYEKLFPVLSVQRVIDNFVNSLDLSEVEATYKPGGAPPYHPSVLLKVILYAYSRNIYGCRPISELCEMDMVCQWFTNFEAPSFSTINRFRTVHLGDERTLALFAELVKILVNDDLVSFEECTYVDGTTVESRASRTKLVWVQAQRRFSEMNTNKINAIVNNARQAQAEDAKELLAEEDGNAQQGEVDNAEPTNNENESAESTESSDEQGEKKKRTRAVHMSEDQVRQIREELHAGKLNLSKAEEKELEERLDKADHYREVDQMCGDKSGTAITDPDSVAMHPKDDVMRKGQCRPMYDVQFMTQSQFILWFDLFGVTTDISAFPLFLNSLPQEFTPAMLAADAGYGSYENYLLAISRGIDPYFKYSLYDKESSPRFIPDPYKAEYLPELPDGSLKCPGGILRKTREAIEKKNGITYTMAYYRTDQCANCPFRDKCHGSTPKDYREVKRKKEWHLLKPQIKEKLDSELGQALLANRSKDVEPTFAHTKWAGAYRRFRHFGVKRCRMDLGLRAIAHNLKKYISHLKELIKGGLSPHLRAHYSPKTAQNSPIAAFWGTSIRIFRKIRAIVKILIDCEKFAAAA